MGLCSGRRRGRGSGDDKPTDDGEMWSAPQQHRTERASWPHIRTHNGKEIVLVQYSLQFPEYCDMASLWTACPQIRDGHHAAAAIQNARLFLTVPVVAHAAVPPAGPSSMNQRYLRHLNSSRAELLRHGWFRGLCISGISTFSLGVMGRYGTSWLVQALTL